MDGAEKLAYFLDEDSIRSVLPDWPEEAALVLCLDEDGAYEAVIHHRDEGRAVLRKVAAVLGRPPGQFMVAPPIDGYPTRRVLFSEEAQLLSLLEGRSDLVDAAVDYTTNRRFADDAEEAPPKTAHRKKSFILPKVRKPAEAPALPPGYSLAGAHEEVECLFVEAEVFGHDQRVRVVIAPEHVKVQTRPVRVAEVGFRDDFARFVLPRGALRNWRPGEPAILDIPVEHFPAGLAERLAGARRRAEVTITRRGIFVAPGPRREAMAAASVAEPVLPVADHPRWLFTPARAAAVVLIVAGVLTGTTIKAFLPDRGEDVGAVRAPAEPVALLDETPAADSVLAALARGQAGPDVE